MTITALVAKLYAKNSHRRLDERIIASAVTPRRCSLLYKKEKNLFGLAGAGFVALMISGCAFNPASMPVEPRDNVLYEDVGAKGPVKEQKFRLAIYVSQGDYSKTGDIAKSLDSSLTSALADFAFFQIVDRSSAEAVQQERFFSGEDVNANMFKSADVIITAKLNGFNAITESETYNYYTKTIQKNYTVSGSVDFRFFSASNPGEARLVKNITKTFTSASPSDFPALALKAAQECAKAFAQELGSRYAPPARVLETRGNCQAAQVSFGSNYGAVPGSKVEFFEYVDRSKVLKGQTRVPQVITTGTVRLSEIDTCWVEVDNYETVQIKQGHYVRLCSDQSKGFLDGLKDNIRDIK